MFLAPMAYPVRSAVLGDTDFSGLVDKLPFVGEAKDREGYQVWDPWLDCVADSFGIFRQRLLEGSLNFPEQDTTAELPLEEFECKNPAD